MDFEAMWSRVGNLGMGLGRNRQCYAPQSHWNAWYSYYVYL